jgi:cysteine desulfurase
LINARFVDEVLWTSGGTESNNTAIIGSVLKQMELNKSKNHVISSVFEHPATREVLQFLKAKHGVQVTLIDVDSNGFVKLVRFFGSAFVISNISGKIVSLFSLFHLLRL